MKIRNFLCAGACVAALTGMAVPTVSDVVVQSRWPWSTKVDVHFVLSGVTAPVDVVCTFKDGGTALNAPTASLSGDLEELQNGAYTITWDPVAAGYGPEKKLSALTAEIATVATKLYMIVDLSSSLANTVEARVSYTNEVIGTNGQWADRYKTDCVVFRRIRAGTFTMGAKSSESSRGIETGFRRQVTLTKDFYIGVFEIPQKIFKLIFGSGYPFSDAGGKGEFTTTPDARPVSHITYNHIRSTNWSCTNTLAEARAVTSSSWIGKFRAKVGDALQFDLPTEAQWEYACRAGTDASLYNGYDVSKTATQDSHLDSLGRYRYNGGYLDNGETLPGKTATTNNATANIGSYEPNAWGLYDMLGNVEEWVLDWGISVASGDMYDESVAQTVDPRGPRMSNDTSRNFRVTKGGAFNMGACDCRCSTRYARKSDTGFRGEQYAGFRLCLTPNEY